MYIASSQSNQVYPATAMNLDVIKLNNSGEPDTAFGVSGLSHINILALNPDINQFNVKSLYVQADGKIVILAAAASQYLNPQFENSRGLHTLVRLKANGQRDSTFNGNGVLLARVTPGNEDVPSALAVDESVAGQPKYYVGGSSLPYGSWHLGPTMFFITRYLNNGTIDVSFNTTGYLQGSGTLINTGTGTGHTGNITMKIVANQKLLVAGAHSSRKFFVMRLLPNGNFDSSFAGTGRILRQVSFISALNALGATHILSDNSVAFTAEDITYNYTPNSYDSLFLHAARQNADGTPMMNFGVNGELHYNYTAKGLYHKETFDDRGRMLLGYYKHIGNNTSQKIHLARFTVNGLPDTSFITNGVLESEPILQDDWINPGSLLGGLQYARDYKKLYLCGTYSKASGSFGIIAFRYKFPEIVISGIAGVNTLHAIIYPNPTNNELYIELAGNGNISSVTLTDMMGKIVMSRSIISGNSTALLLHHLPAGQYMLQVADEHNHSASRIVTKY